jgi:hypothetical protein
MRLFDRLPGRRRIVAVQHKLLEAIITGLAQATADEPDKSRTEKRQLLFVLLRRG